MTKKEEILSLLARQTAGTSDPAAEGFTTQELAQRLGMQRSNVSTLLNELVEDGKVEKITGRPVRYRAAAQSHVSRTEGSCFKVLDCCEGSLKPMIQMAKAAILYPEHSLNTLIVGPSGSGKTTFAYLMYQFAQECGVISVDAPFVRMSCHEDEPEDTLEQRLFGAGGALERASTGVLLVDNLNHLPTALRERLLDAAEIESAARQDIILICAMSDKVRQSVMEGCSIRFSAKIEMPNLAARSMAERFVLVKRFLGEESVRMKHTLRVNEELLYCLCLYHCEHNVKQLKNDIRLGCANAYVRAFQSGEDELPLYLNDFPVGVRRGLLYYKKNRDQLETLIPQGYSYVFSEDDMRKEDRRAEPISEMAHGSISESIYDIIDRKAEMLKNRGIGEDDIGRIINAELEYDMKRITSQIGQNKVSRDTLYKIMDRRIVDMVDVLLKEASHQLNKVYPETTFYGLCLHLSSVIERGGSSQQRLSNEKILEVIENYRDEYALCTRFVTAIEQELELSLSIDEAVMITLFLCNANTSGSAEKGPVLLIAMHGDSTASSMAEVVNALAGSGNTYAYDMPLDKDVQQACDELKVMVQEIDRGQGILLLYDMGSLRTMAELITKETGVPIRTVALPATLIAMDCARKACSMESLDEICDSAQDSFRDFYTHVLEPEGRPRTQKVILTLCMTGQGGALQMKHYLEKNAALNDMQVIPLAVSDRRALLTEVNRIKENHEIYCVIGTYDPELHGVPFISVVQLFETPVNKLDILLSMPESEREKVNYEMIYAYLQEQVQTLDIKILRRCLPKAIAKLKKVAQGLTQEQELGLFLHIACAVDRIRSGERMPENPNRQSLIRSNKRLYNDLREILTGIEDAFDIRFSDDELAYIIGIVKKI